VCFQANRFGVSENRIDVLHLGLPLSSQDHPCARILVALNVSEDPLVLLSKLQKAVSIGFDSELSNALAVFHLPDWSRRIEVLAVNFGNDKLIKVFVKSLHVKQKGIGVGR